MAKQNQGLKLGETFNAVSGSATMLAQLAALAGISMSALGETLDFHAHRSLWASSPDFFLSPDTLLSSGAWCLAAGAITALFGVLASAGASLVQEPSPDGTIEDNRADRPAGPFGQTQATSPNAPH